MILISPIQFYIFNVLLFGFVFIPNTIEHNHKLNVLCVLMLFIITSLIIGLGWFSYKNPRKYPRKKMILLNIATAPLILFAGFIYDAYIC
jgi:hypothetical protein